MSIYFLPFYLTSLSPFVNSTAPKPSVPPRPALTPKPQLHSSVGGPQTFAKQPPVLAPKKPMIPPTK